MTADIIKILGSTAVILIILQMTGVIKLYTPKPRKGDGNGGDP